MLYLNPTLAAYIASCLPADDPIRTGLAELIAREEILPCDEPPELTILLRGKMFMEVYDEGYAQRIRDVLTAPGAWPAVLEAGGRLKAAAGAVEPQ